MNRQSRFIRRVLVWLVVALLLALPEGEVSARKWVFADGRAWNVLRACEDGIVVSAIYDGDLGLEGSPFDPINLAVYHYTNPAFGPPNHEGRLPEETPSAYGPQILPYSSVVMAEHDAPLEIVTGEGDPKSYPFHAFAILRWATALTSGEDTVVVIQDENNQSGDFFGSAEPIRDCTVDQYVFPTGDSQTIGPDQLAPASPAVPADQLIYRLDWTPSKGDLFKDEGQLDLLSTFSQADIDAGSLTYRPDGNGESDFFAARPFQTSWVSQPLSGEDPHSGSYEPTLSADGRYIAFANPSVNIDPDHTGNGYEQIYLRDRDADGNGVFDEPGGESLTLITLGLDGNPGNENSNNAHLSADGRYMVFQSLASNLVEEDEEGYNDIFVAGEGQIVRVSVAADGTPGDGDSYDPVISGDGRFVAFSSLAKNFGNTSAENVFIIYVHDRDADEDGVFDEPGQVSTEAIASDADQDSWGPGISADGRYVVFSSLATNLHPNDNKNWVDVFLYDRTTDELELVSGYDGTGSEWLSDGDSWAGSKQSISADGRYVVFGSTANFGDQDGNGFEDIYLYDRQTHRNRLISSEFTGLSATNDSFMPSISADGRFVAYRSLAPFLVEEDTEETQDVFVYDQRSGETVRVSENIAGPAENEGLGGIHPMLSADGTFVVFDTFSTNLIPGATTQCTYNDDTYQCMNTVVAYVGFPFFFPLEFQAPSEFQQAVFLPLLR